MEKEVNYNGKKYIIEIKWSGNNYFVRDISPEVVSSSFVLIPMECFDDVEKIKPYIIQALISNNGGDLKNIKSWDGNL